MASRHYPVPYTTLTQGTHMTHSDDYKFRLVQHTLTLHIIFMVNGEESGISTKMTSIGALKATKALLVETYYEIKQVADAFYREAKTKGNK